MIAALDGLSRKQWGLVTRDQLVAMGLTKETINGRVKDGQFVRVHRQVYRLPGVPACWEQRVGAALLASTPGAVASHACAARIWQFRGITTETVELTVTRRSRVSGVVTHSSPGLPGADRTRHDRIDLTTPARTFCDLSAKVPELVLARALDEALRTGLTTLDSVTRCADRLPSCRPAGLAKLRALLDARRFGPALGDSPLEGKILGWLRRAGLPDPVVQYRVRLGARTYRFDAAYPDLRIGLEFDGWHEHGKRSVFETDKSRDNDLGVAGWLVLHFGDRHGCSEVIGTVARALATQEERRRVNAATPAQDHR